MRTSKTKSKKSYSWKIILFFLVAASTLAMKINYFSPKKFQSVAQLKLNGKIIVNHNGKLTRVIKNLFGKTVVYDAALKNAVMDGIKNKNLNVTCFQEQPLFRTELYNSSPLTVTYSVKNQKFYKQKFNFKYTYENNFTLNYIVDGIERERDGEFGKEIHETDLIFTVSKNPKINPDRVEYLLTKNLQFAISTDEAIADNLLKTSVDISTSENGTTTVALTGSTPEKALMLSNCISESLLAQCNTSNNLELINQQLAKVTGELETARNEITGSKSRRITNVTSTAPTPFANIDEQKKNLELLSTALENLSDALRKNRNIPDATTDYGLINDPLITQFIDTLNEKIAQRKNTTGTEISTLNEEINTLQNTVADVVRNSRKKVALEQDKINNTYTTSYPGILVAKANESNLSVLNQKLFLTEKLYNYIADKKTETEGSMTLTEGSFIQKATLPRESSNANATVVWILAIILGLLTGSIAAFIMSMILKSFATPASAIQNESSIAMIANIENETKKNLSTQFRNLCTKMLLQREVGEKQIITVTSDSSGQGKTFIATHLAKSLAALDLNVLVLDMNLANPSIEENFETQSSYTLADVLQKQIGIQEAVQITSIPGLDILTAGNFVNGINSLIATNSMNKILNELKGHYDFIIIDAADTTNSLDAMPCMKFSNSTLYVSNLKSNEHHISKRVSQIKADYHIENIHCISNNIKLSKKQKPAKAVIRNLESATKTPFLKKVALWFY